MSRAKKVLKRARSWAGRMRYAYELAGPRRYLFVFSHMRSYSSLLCHILNSSPEIDGYVEMHKPYTKQLELLELMLRVRSTTGTRLKGRYVVDKVLHNYEMSPQILRRSEVYALYSVRDPEQAVRSIIAMGLRRKKPDWKSDPEKVVNHYIRRLQRMEQQSAHTKQRSLFFEAQALIDDTDRVLAGITKFLGLKEPLKPQYKTAEMTGKPGMGDASSFISTGEIVPKRDDYTAMHVPEELMEKARAAFDSCRKTLTKNCTVTIEAASPQQQTGTAAQS